LSSSTNYLPRNLSNKLAAPASLQALHALPAEHQTLKATNTELRRSAVVNLLQLGNMLEPQPAVPSVADLKAAAHPPNTMFLTVTVQHFDHGVDRQLYRDDTPLYPLQDAALHAKRAEYGGHYKVLEAVSRAVEGPSGGGGVVRVYPPRSMIVLPACPADVTIYITLSRVSQSFLSQLHFSSAVMDA
jgi:hypothetical protein